jgi:hypothetical protein
MFRVCDSQVAETWGNFGGVVTPAQTLWFQEKYKCCFVLVKTSQLIPPTSELFLLHFGQPSSCHGWPHISRSSARPRKVHPLVSFRCVWSLFFVEMTPTIKQVHLAVMLLYCSTFSAGSQSTSHSSASCWLYYLLSTFPGWSEPMLYYLHLLGLLLSLSLWSWASFCLLSVHNFDSNWIWPDLSFIQQCCIPHLYGVSSDHSAKVATDLVREKL